MFEYQFLSNAQLSSNRDFDLNAWLSHYGTQVKTVAAALCFDN